LFIECLYRRYIILSTRTNNIKFFKIVSIFEFRPKQTITLASLFLISSTKLNYYDFVEKERRRRKKTRDIFIVLLSSAICFFISLSFFVGLLLKALLYHKKSKNKKFFCFKNM